MDDLMESLGVRQATIAAIEVPTRLRSVDPSAASALAENIAERGLLQPIVVRPKPGKPEAFILVAGAHRLEAVKELGWEDVTCRVVKADDLVARLFEIDENLVRRDLSVLDEAKFLAERKAIYERLHPETKRGAQGGRGGKKNETDSESFSKTIAGRMGRSDRHIRRRVALWNALDPRVREQLELHPVADDAGQLLALAKQSATTQRSIASRIVGGTAGTVGEALKIAQPGKVVSPPEEQFNALKRAWNRAGKAARKKFLRFIEEEGDE